MSEPIFCIPALTRTQLIAALQNDLDSQSSFDRRLNFVSAAESKSSALVAVKARLNTLLEVYKGEYHTDSYDLDRNVHRVQNGQELIWFWGSTDQISLLRNSFATGQQLDVKLGTVTLISAEGEFGPGYGESCRSGSVTSEVGAKAAFITRLLDFMTGESSILHDRYHSIISTTRNCAERPTASGGEAIHTIAKRYVRSMFW